MLKGLKNIYIFFEYLILFDGNSAITCSDLKSWPTSVRYFLINKGMSTFKLHEQDIFIVYWKNKIVIIILFFKHYYSDDTEMHAAHPYGFYV